MGDPPQALSLSPDLLLHLSFPLSVFSRRLLWPRPTSACSRPNHLAAALPPPHQRTLTPPKSLSASAIAANPRRPSSALLSFLSLEGSPDRVVTREVGAATRVATRGKRARRHCCKGTRRRRSSHMHTPPPRHWLIAPVSHPLYPSALSRNPTTTVT